MKIPFERTIAGAYRFAFSNILSVIGVGWFPFLLYGVLAAGLVYLLWPVVEGLWIADQKTIDQAKLLTSAPQLAGAVVLLIGALVLTQAMVTVGLLRKALGMHPGPVFVYFSLGGQVWRLIGSYLLMMLLIWGGALLVGAAVAAIAVLLGKVAEPAQAPVTGILIFCALLAYIYSIIRLSFFIPAVVVAENHIGLRRSWHLGGGNFWRIVGIMLIVSLPIQLAAQTITSTMLQLAMTPGLTIQQGPMTDVESHKFFADLIAAARRIGPYVVLVQLLYLVLLSGLNAGAVANAYKAITGGTDAKAAA
jgi:hypothetical protein